MARRDGGSAWAGSASATSTRAASPSPTRSARANRELAIPPAWTNVWISPNPRARLQATGIDSAGRKQYRYHAASGLHRSAPSTSGCSSSHAACPGCAGARASHLRLGPYEHDWACALAVGVVNKAWFRVGSERHARSSRTYGVTTLRKRHVQVSGDEMTFCFRAKNRKLVRRTSPTARSRPRIAALLVLPGGRACFASSATATSWRSPRRR